MKLQEHAQRPRRRWRSPPSRRRHAGGQQGGKLRQQTSRFRASHWEPRRFKGLHMHACLLSAAATVCSRAGAQWLGMGSVGLERLRQLSGHPGQSHASPHPTAQQPPGRPADPLVCRQCAGRQRRMMCVGQAAVMCSHWPGLASGVHCGTGCAAKRHTARRHAAARGADVRPRPHPAPTRNHGRLPRRAARAAGSLTRLCRAHGRGAGCAGAYAGGGGERASASSCPFLMRICCWHER